jgi:hypothetical protein
MMRKSIAGSVALAWATLAAGCSMQTGEPEPVAEQEQEVCWQDPWTPVPCGAAICGDGQCKVSEVSYCPSDCGYPTSYCGDGICTPSEWDTGCALDCPTTCVPPPGKTCKPSSARPSYPISSSPAANCSYPRQPCVTWNGYQATCKYNFLGGLSCAL